MEDYKIVKSFYKLTEDYSDGNCFLPAGTEGVVIDCHTVGLIPNLSESKYNEIVRREFLAKANAQFLLLIAGSLIAIHVNILEETRHEGCPIFEDDEDRKQHFDELFRENRERYLEQEKRNAST